MAGSRGNSPSLPKITGTWQYELCPGLKQYPFQVNFVRKSLPIYGGSFHWQSRKGLVILCSTAKRAIVSNIRPRGVTFKYVDAVILDSPDFSLPLIPFDFFTIRTQKSNSGNRRALQGFDYFYCQSVHDSLPLDTPSRFWGNERRKCPNPYGETKFRVAESGQMSVSSNSTAVFNPMAWAGSEGP